MKKVLFAVLIVLLSFSFMGCEAKEQRTAKGWAIEAVKSGYDGTDIPATPYLIAAEKATAVFDDTDLEHFACFIITVEEDLDNDAIERKFAVIVAWEPTYFNKVHGSTTFPESALTDIDVVEIGVAK